MKILDEKGKLFGKINLIDFLVLLILVAVLIFMVIRLIPSKPVDVDPAELPADTAKITYTVLVSGVTPELYDEIQAQMAASGNHEQLLASGKMIDGYVIGVEAAPHIIYAADANGLLTPSEEQGELARYDLTFTIEACVDDPTINLVSTQEIRVGKSYYLKTAGMEFTAIITSCKLY